MKREEFDKLIKKIGKDGDNGVPYRCTCNIPYEVVGRRETTKDEDEAAKKIHKQIMEQFGLVKQEENNNEEKA